MVNLTIILIEASMSPKPRVASFSAAVAKKKFSELLGRVAYRRETILILKHNKPMAKLVPATTAEHPTSLADVEGWLENDHAFFSNLKRIAARRRTRNPRAIARKRRKQK